MFATVGSTAIPAPKGGHGYSAKMPQIPKSFSVRIFKGPAMSTFPYAAATAQFDVGYRPVAFATSTITGVADPRQSQGWLPQRHDNDSRPFPGFISRQSSSIPSTSLTSNLRPYDNRTVGNTLPPYSIYPDLTKDTYVYERSDTYSFSEADESPAPSSIFSPALSSDSTTTVKSSDLPDRSSSRSGQRPTTPSITLPNSSSQPSIQRQLSSSVSNALSIVRTASSRGPASASFSNPSDSSLSIIPPPVSRSTTLSRLPPPQSTRPPPRGPSPTNQYPSGFLPVARTPSAGTWQDYVEESILDQSSEIARMNASLNARASVLYSQDNSALDHNDYQSIPQIPLPPDDTTQYASVMSSSPESYYATAADTTSSNVAPTSRRNSPVSPIPPGPQPRRTSPQQDRVASTSGPLVPYQVNGTQQQSELFIPPLTYEVPPESYSDAGSYSDTIPPPSQGLTGIEYAQNQASSVSSSSSWNGPSNSSRISPPLPPQIPTSTRMNGIQIPSNITSSIPTLPTRQEQSRPLPIPVSSVIPNSGVSFPHTMPVATFPSQGPTPRASSVSPPVPMMPEGGRARKDSLAVEAIRSARKRDRAPSVSPPIEDANRRPNPVILAAGGVPVSGQLSSQQVPVRSPINPQPPSNWLTNATVAQIPPQPTALLPQERPGVSDSQSPTTATQPSSTNPPTTASRRPILGPRRMNSDPAPANPANSTALMPPPQRRHTDNELPIPSGAPPSCVSRFRVRWCERLVCPSPIAPGQRRKGWFNRRGDQLWTNEGAYKPPPPGREYPVDLDSYPEYGQGWMNEEGTRIDMEHRLIPKAPLRSALKQTQS